MTYVDGLLWLKDDSDNFLVRVDVNTGAGKKVPLAGFTKLPSFYDDPAIAADGSLWVRTSSGTVARLDPRSGGLLARYPADPKAGGGFIAVDIGSLRIVNFDTDTGGATASHHSEAGEASNCRVVPPVELECPAGQ